MSLFILIEGARRSLHRHQHPEGVFGRYLCSSRCCLQVSALAMVAWGGTHPPSVPDTESHRGKAAAQIWVETCSLTGPHTFETEMYSLRLEGGKRGTRRFRRAEATGDPPGLLPLSMVWAVVPMPNHSVSCMALTLFC